jgi:hypothetical protein
MDCCFSHIYPAPKSDHNPDEKTGCVRAIDIDAGLSDDKRISAYLADQIRLYGKNHGRIAYVIHEEKIASPLLVGNGVNTKALINTIIISISFQKRPRQQFSVLQYPTTRRQVMKLTNKHKAAIKSYLRAVAASGITVLLAIVADIRPEFAILAGALIAPLAKAIDPSSGTEADYGVNAK